MNYYTIWVCSARYKKNTPLTYSYEGSLNSGQVVIVPFQNTTVMGLVDKATSKPSFKTKPVLKLLVERPLPAQIIELFKWLPSYYPGSVSSHLQLFLPQSLLSNTSDVVEARKKTTKEFLN